MELVVWVRYLCLKFLSMRIGFLSLVSLFVIGCTSSPQEVVRINRGATQGTTYQVSYKVISGTDYQRGIDSVLFAVDQSLSAWNPHSTLSKVNRNELDSVVDPLFTNVIRAGQRISRETFGAFDMTIGSVIDLWGFGSESNGRPDSLKIDSLIQESGYNKFRLDPSGKIMKPKSMKLNVNAIAQGYSVDLIAEYLESKGVTDYLVEVGGETRTRGTYIDDEIWRIGIDKPGEEIDADNRYQVIVKLDSASLATSGNYRKFKVDSITGIKYGHTIDPLTGYPAQDRLLSVSIITLDCMSADAYATACMSMGLDKAKKFVEERAGVEAFFVFSSLTGEWETWSTPGFDEMVN